MDYSLAHERFSDLRETIFVDEGRANGEIPEGKEPQDGGMLPKMNTTDQLFQRHSSDLAIGGESLQRPSNVVLDQCNHPVGQRESQHLGSA